MRKEQFIDLKSDYAFKVIFGKPENKELTISFLNSLLDKHIRDITFHNVEIPGMNADSRRVVFDLFCEGDDGELFVVEMQKRKQKYFTDRVLYYASFAIQMQASIENERFSQLPEEERKKWNYHYNKVYVVCLLDYVMDGRYPDKYLWNVVRMDRELREPFSETLNEIYIELPKFRLELSECDSFYKQFLLAMNNGEMMESLSKEMNPRLYDRLQTAIALQRMSVEERLAYEMSIAADRDFCACMATSYEDGLEKGRTEGLAEGEAKGKSEGLLEGMRQMLRNMRDSGMDLKSIARIARMPEGEVQALLAE